MTVGVPRNPGHAAPVLAPLPVGLSGEGEVVEAGDAMHRVVHAVAFGAAVAEDLPALHPGESVLDTGADLAVGPVVLLQAGSSVRPGSRRCGMTRPVPR